jgi:phosphatidate cytidylyltransferase
MSFNWQTFGTRTLTAIVFAVIMLVGLLWNQWSFFILFSIIHFGCWVEYQNLVALIDKNYATISPFHKYGVMIAGWCIMLCFTSTGYHIGGMRLNELGCWLGLIFLFILPVTELLFAKQINLKVIAHSFFGLIYISLSLALMMDLYAHFNSVVKDDATKNIYLHDVPYFYPALIIASLWINDTMAYIMGSLVGKTKMSAISPKKTWEGTISGIVLSIASVYAVAKWILNAGDLSILVATIAFIASIAGTFGDLLESKLKRLAGVKDSGHIMPGHGGFLDRFDSLLVATPFVWLFVYFFMK